MHFTCEKVLIGCALPEPLEEPAYGCGVHVASCCDIRETVQDGIGFIDTVLAALEGLHCARMRKGGVCREKINTKKQEPQQQQANLRVSPCRIVGSFLDFIKDLPDAIGF